MSLRIPSRILTQVFRKHAQKILIYLRASKNTGSKFDPYRNTGYLKTRQNPITLKGLVSTVSANSLIIRELGLTESGAKKIILKNSDVEYIRLSNKIIINNQDYYVYNDAVGNKLQIADLGNGYTSIIIFRKDI